ncbi:ZIP zinc transporter-domain-containing protein [Dipodascopsis tothii]|uniref:ZIP zinc transporter-domain-containing protein n=1 Tax=Dipodascopsis tothii TaxID=44089 RepID=UPI0034CFA1D4
MAGQGFFALVLMSILMGIASFGAGMLPLAVSLSPDQLRLLSTVGTGVLMGTSLIVIIPEGVETLYTVPQFKQRIRPGIGSPTKPPINIGAGTNAGLTRALDRVDGIAAAVRYDATDDDDDDDRGRRVSTPASAHTPTYIALSLISGFVLMYLVEHLPEIYAQHKGHHHGAVDVSELRSYSTSTPMTLNEMAGHKAAMATTTGLVIHAAADGIALGASAASSNVALEAMVFLALMLHKAPAAFGMSAVLLRTGIARRTIRQHLLVFSLAAPIGALVTWIMLVLIGTTSHATIQWWTGILLLFSGGTFLFVAIHVMQSSHDHGDAPKNTVQLVQDSVAAICGLLLPLVTLLAHE